MDRGKVIGMGWWELDGDLQIGDGVLDIVQTFLHDLSDEYLRDVGRKPQLKEILACLEAVLRSDPGSFFEGGEKLLVSEISARVKKRPKKQSFVIGDVFIIPIGDGSCSFGRVTPQANLLEYFNVKQQDCHSTVQLRGATKVPFPFLTATEALEDWRWVIIGNLPFSPGEFEVQHFLLGDQVAVNESPGKDGLIDVTSQLRTARLEEKQRLPNLMLFSPELVIEKLKDILNS